jgi:hypothetical protein
MKKVILFFCVVVFSFSLLTAQNIQTKNNPVGSWKFEAPYAPEGYTSGTIVVGLEKQKYSASLSFTGSEYMLTGENVKSVNDSILFSIYLEGQDIKVMLKIEDKTKMTGKAVYSEGEVPLTLLKDTQGAELK